ncbi:myosin IC heavy chain-like [Erinaceus europaeus]|uniref:Myosin IC heavy chain-like n=1 Tax=Erinaceus europaeus TaxID=9365 RepID=A0ABM3WH39_ERIEU|nr:myosin IC heavy chain-like [Erinaceus europaeus]
MQSPLYSDFTTARAAARSPRPSRAPRRTDLRSPPHLGRGPRTGRRRPRPPSPPAPASSPGAAATAGAHAGPALPSPETEAGRGGDGAAGKPTLVAAACPQPGGVRGPPDPARLRRGEEAPPPGAESAGSQR